MSISLGIPWLGRKQKIARQIVDILPAAPCLIDAFAGGCSVTHAALLSGKWDTVVANDLLDGPELFQGRRVPRPALCRHSRAQFRRPEKFFAPVIFYLTNF